MMKLPTIANALLFLSWSAAIVVLPQQHLRAETVKADSNKKEYVDQRVTAATKQMQEQTAKPETASNSNDEASVLPEVKINEKRFKDERINKTQSITTISAQDIDRSQPSSIFDAVLHQ